VRRTGLRRVVGFSTIIWLVNYSGCSRSDKDVAARVGDVEISAQEYGARLTDFFRSSSTNDNLKIRRQILENMIHEELILAEAKKRGWLDEAAYREKSSRVRTQAILDEYRQRFVAGAVTVDDEDLKRAFARLNVRMSARHLYARSEQEAWKLRDLLLKGATFEELALKVFQDPKLRSNGGYIGYFTFGEMDPAFEDTAYRLRIGEISEPVKTAQGYSIIRVEDRLAKPIATEYEFLQQKNQVARIVRASKIDAKVKQVTEATAQQLSPRFNESVVNALFQAWSEIALHERIEEMPGKPRKMDGRSMNGVVVDFSTGRWSVDDVMDRMTLTSERQRRYVHSTDEVKQFITGLLVREQFLQRALNENIDKLPDVKKRVDAEMRMVILDRWRALVTDSVNASENMLKDRYEKNKSAYQFPEGWDLSEIAVPSRKKALSLLRQAQRGVAFGLLARKHSVRPNAASNEGHLGLLTRQQLGAWVSKVAAVKDGEVVGPFEMDGFYSLIKVNRYRTARQKTFEQSKPQMKEELEWQLKQQAFLMSLEQLRKSTSIWINDPLLATIQLNNVTSRSTL